MPLALFRRQLSGAAAPPKQMGILFLFTNTQRERVKAQGTYPLAL